jgi:uncharacterized tellurite resistance protein B-like protein
MSILKLFGISGGDRDEASDPVQTETVRKIVAELDHLPPQRARFVAAFAYILSRVAHADMSISDDETRAMERVLVERGHLPEQQAVIVVQMAKTQNLLLGGTENYVVTREYNRLASHDEKLALLECLFAVSAADQSVSTIEANVIRQIADELKLEHREYVEVRSKFRDHLAVLKPPRPDQD